MRERVKNGIEVEVERFGVVYDVRNVVNAAGVRLLREKEDRIDGVERMFAVGQKHARPAIDHDPDRRLVESTVFGPGREVVVSRA